MGEPVVILLRLVVPISIFRWPLGGIIASIVVDTLDVVIVDAFDLGSFRNYAALDKLLDTYYLTFAAIVSLRWEDTLARHTSIVLFTYRLLGVLLFEVTQVRLFLFVFPNLFENFYVAFLVLKRFVAGFALTPLRLAVLLILLLIPKLAQEYLLHYAEAKPWGWFKRHIFRDALWF